MDIPGLSAAAIYCAEAIIGDIISTGDWDSASALKLNY
jgi:hypothetical protein